MRRRLVGGLVLVGLGLAVAEVVVMQQGTRSGLGIGDLGVATAYASASDGVSGRQEQQIAGEMSDLRIMLTTSHMTSWGLRSRRANHNGTLIHAHEVKLLCCGGAAAGTADVGTAIPGQEQSSIALRSSTALVDRVTKVAVLPDIDLAFTSSAGASYHLLGHNSKVLMEDQVITVDRAVLRDKSGIAEISGPTAIMLMDQDSMIFTGNSSNPVMTQIAINR